MQLSCSGGGESDRAPNTVTGAMGLPQVARWKAEPDKKISSLEKHGVFKLVPIASVPAGHKVASTRWVLRKLRRKIHARADLSCKDFNRSMIRTPPE